MIDLATGEATAYFYAEHATNTGNTVLYICGEQVGLNGADMAYRAGTTVGLDVRRRHLLRRSRRPGRRPDDHPARRTVLRLRAGYAAVPDVAGLLADTMYVDWYGTWPGNTPQLGLMLLTNGDRGAGCRGGATEATETILLYPATP